MASSSSSSSQNFPYSSTSSAPSTSSSVKDKMPNSIPRIGSLASTQNETESMVKNRSRSASGTLLLDSISGNFEFNDGRNSIQGDPRVEEATQTEELDLTSFQPHSIEAREVNPEEKLSHPNLGDHQDKENVMTEGQKMDQSQENSKRSSLLQTQDFSYLPDPEESKPVTSDQEVHESQIENLSSINQQTKLIVPPLNFDLVNAGLYRSGHPNERNFDFMKGLGLNGIVYLAQETYLPSVENWAIREGVKVHQFGLSVNKEPFAEMEASKVLSLLEVLLDSRNHPLLIHCNKGKYRVGCIVALIRRLQNWSHTSLFEEFERFAGGRGRGADLEFIETFDLGKVKFNPAFKPSWL